MGADMIYFIVNPKAASGRALKKWGTLERLIRKRDVVYQVYMTEGQGHAAKIAAALTAGEERSVEKTLAVLGGDGTLNEVLQGLHLQAKVKLAYIPAGSANDFSKGHGLPANPKKALSYILDQESPCRVLDYGMITCASAGRAPFYRRFLVSSGLGFDAAVCRSLNCSQVKKICNRLHMGSFAYILVGLWQILLHKRCGGELVLDGGRRIPLRRISFISAHILPREGGGFRFAPNADPQDGMLSLCVVSGVTKLELIPILVFALFGIRRLPNGAENYRCREAEIFLQEALPAHTDGEVFDRMKEVHFRCENKKLRLIVDRGTLPAKREKNRRFHKNQ